MEIKVMQSVTEANENKAKEIRKLLKSKGIFMVNLISSPGSGKTLLLEQTLPILKKKYKIAVIEGDVATDKDAQRLMQYDIPIIMINTRGGCHLDSQTISKALNELNLNNLDIIFIENVGNLICPAEFDLGEDEKIAMVSTPEGADKPIKYPYLFRGAGLCILNKTDLLDLLNFNKNEFYKDIKNINRELDVLELSCK
ncbi:MAG: hydrogenase nickel incorporation protein HypB, partial [Spirochaetes bacterium]|nr:hydrogenase nickel incorporation protein HypB [Spirochaetota bacterium]